MAEEAHILAILQSLRRYARLLTGDQRAGDDAVARAFVSAFRQPFAGRDDLKPHLFEHISYVWTPSQTHVRVDPLKDGDALSADAYRPRQLTPLAWQVFLLASLEQFSDGEIRRILGLSEVQLESARSGSAGEGGAWPEAPFQLPAARRLAPGFPADRDLDGRRAL